MKAQGPVVEQKQKHTFQKKQKSFSTTINPMSSMCGPICNLDQKIKWATVD